jgi:spore germination protein YaaH
MKRRDCHWPLLDMESLRVVDREHFNQWSATLIQELKKSISPLRSTIAVHGKTSTKGDWYGAEAQDWRSLCKLHDELLIMAYDFSYPGSTPPGETAPLGWVEKILAYGRKVCPPEKLRLGLAAYGYVWPTREVITERAARAKGKGRERYFIETAAMRQQKIALARRYGIHRFFLWALGMY